MLSELPGAEAGLQEHSRHPRSEEVAVVELDHLEQSPAGAGVEEAEETLPTRLTRKKGEEAQAVQEEPFAQLELEAAELAQSWPLEEGQTPSEGPEAVPRVLLVGEVAVAQKLLPRALKLQELALEHSEQRPEPEAGVEGVPNSQNSRSALIPRPCAPPGVELENRDSYFAPNSPRLAPRR